MAAEEVDQYGEDDADDDHGDDGEVDTGAFAVEAQVAGEFAEPVEQAWGIVEYEADDNEDDTGEYEPA